MYLQYLSVFIARVLTDDELVTMMTALLLIEQRGKVSVGGERITGMRNKRAIMRTDQSSSLKKITWHFPVPAQTSFCKKDIFPIHSLDCMTSAGAGALTWKIIKILHFAPCTHTPPALLSSPLCMLFPSAPSCQ